MATKKDLSSSARVKLDDDFDFGSDDFSTMMPKDDRKPATKFASGFLGGAKDSMLDSAFIRKTIKASLPDGYGMAMDFEQDVRQNARQLYNKAATEIKPAISEMARATEKLMPASATKLRQKLGEIDRWGSSMAREYSGDDKNAQREAGLAALLAETTGYTLKDGAKRDAKMEARDRMQESLAMTRHRDIFGMLNTIAMSTSRSSQFQDKLVAAYQKKSLEVQYRSYFVAMDALEESKKQNAFMREQISSIRHNTGLPDYVKLTESERVAQMLRNRIGGKIADTLLGSRANIGSRIVKQASAVLNEKMSSAIAAMRDTAANMEEMAFARQQMQEAGLSPAEISGNIAGMFGADWFGNKAAQQFQKWSSKSKGVQKVNDQLKSKFFTGAHKLQGYKNSYAGEDDTMKGKLVKFFKEMIPDMRLDNNVHKDSFKDLNQPHVFTKQTHKTLNEVIPGYLARIFREIQVMRTGDTKIGLTTYDVTRNKFVDKVTARTNALKSVIGDSAKSTLDMQINELMAVVDPENKLSKGARAALGKKMLKDNLAFKDPTKERMTSMDTYKEHSGTAKYAKQLAGHMSGYYADQKGNTALSHENRFTQKFAQLGNQIEGTQEAIQELINLGQYDMLEELGLIDPTHSFIDFDKVAEYHMGGEASGGSDRLSANARAPRASRAKGANPKAASLITQLKSPQATAKIKAAKVTKTRVAKAAPASAAAPAQSTRGSSAGTAAITKAIKANSSQQETMMVAEGIQRLELVLMEGFAGVIKKLNRVRITGSTTGGADSGGDDAEDNRIFSGGSIHLGKLFKRGKGIATNLGGKAWGALNSTVGMARSSAGMAINTVRGVAGSLIGRAQDVYVKGELVPRIEAIKLKAGKYKDAATGKVIKKMKDIKGAVIDENGKLVINAEDLKNSFTKHPLTGKAVALGVKAFGYMKDASDFIGSLIPPTLTSAKDLAKFALRTIKGAMDMPVDMYLPGSNTPVIQATKMRRGEYLIAATKKAATRPSHIKSAIITFVNGRWETVLTDEQVHGGLVDINGKPIMTGFAKLFGFGKRAMEAGLRMAGEAARAVGSMARGLLGRVTGMVGPTGMGGGDHLAVLKKILNVLEKRLPKDGILSGKEESSMLGGVAGEAAGAAASGGVTAWLMKKFGKKDAAGAVGQAAAKSPGFLARNWAKLGRRGKLGALAGAGLLGYSAFGGDANAASVPKGAINTAGMAAGGLPGSNPFDSASLASAGGQLGAQGLQAGAARLGAEGTARAAGATGRFLGKLATPLAAGVEGYDEYNSVDNAELSRAGKLTKATASTVTAGAGAYVGGLGGAALGAKLGGTLGTFIAPGVGTAIGAGIGGIGGGLIGAGMGAWGGGRMGSFASEGLVTRPKAKGVGRQGEDGDGGRPRGELISAEGQAAGAAAGGQADSLESVRFRTYGLIMMETDKVASLRALEAEVIKNVQVGGDDKATWSGGADNVIDAAGVYFGINKNSRGVSAWKTWFKERFLPVFLTYAGLTKAATGSLPKAGLAPSFPQGKKMLVATMICGTRGAWDVTDSPWAGYRLGTDDALVKPLIDKMREELKQQTVKEEVLVKDEKGQDAWKKLEDKTEPEKQTWTDKVKKWFGFGKESGGADMEDKTANSMKSAGQPNAASGSATSGVVMASGPLFDGRNASAYLALGSGVKLDGLNAAMMKNFNGMVDEYGTKTGKTVMVNAGVRSYEEQARLYKKDPRKAAKPGSSMHEAGLALDIPSSTLDDMEKLGLMRKYGFTRPVGGERWHMEPAGIQTDLNGFRANPSAASAAIAASVGRGGGGYGTDPNSKLGTRDATAAKKLLEASIPAKDIGKETAPYIPEQVKLGEAKPASGGAAGSSTPQVATVDNKGRKFDGAGTYIGGVDSESSGGYGGGVGSLAQSVSGSHSGTNFINATPGTGGKYQSLPDGTGGTGWAANKDLIVGAAKMVGVDPKLSTSIVSIESQFNPMAKAPGGSASGFNQFTSATWKEMVDKHGSKYGIPANASVFDGKANAILGAEYTKQNIQALKSVKPNLTATDVYAAHFLGASGAKKLLSSNPNAIAAQIMPEAAAANKNIFYAGGQPRTIAGVYGLLNTKVQKSLQATGVDPSFQSPVGTLNNSGTPATSESSYDAMGNYTGYGTSIADAAPAPAAPKPVKQTLSQVMAGPAPTSSNGPAPISVTPQPSQRAEMSASINEMKPYMEKIVEVGMEQLSVLKIIAAQSAQLTELVAKGPQQSAQPGQGGSGQNNVKPPVGMVRKLV